MKDNHWKGKAASWLFSLFLLLTAIAGCLVLADFARVYREDRFWEDIRACREQGVTPEVEQSPGHILPQYQELYQRNPDMVGWLRIEGARIDCPVMQTKEDPEHYLRRDFDNRDDTGGTPFIDYRCSVSPRRSFNLILYGHYTDSDRLFRRLLDYAYGLADLTAREIRFDTLEEEGIYQLAAAFFYDGTGAVLNDPSSNVGEQAYTFYNYIELDSREGFEQFLEGIEKQKLYQTEVEITPEDEILTIVCCAPEKYSGIKEGGRFVVIAKKIKLKN